MAKAKNVGLIDRIIRIILGVVLIYVGWVVWENNIAGIILDIVGIILIITGIAGYCWLYKLLGIKTCKVCKVPEAEKPMQGEE